MPAKATLLLVLGIALASGSEGAPPPYGVPDSPRPRAQYAYAYDIRDPQSGTYSSKKETRDGDIVYGNYVVEDPDGSRRVVYYSTDGTRGHDSETRQQQVHDKVQPVPVVGFPVYVAPTAPPVHQVQLAPLAISLAPALLERAPSPEHHAPRYETVLTSHPHSYPY